MTVFYIMAILFVIGVILIALEDIVKINKAAVAVGMCILLWLLTILSAGGVFTEHLPHFFNNFIAGFPKFAALSFPDQVTRFLEVAITESLGDVATTLFFVLASMAIIEVLDSHGSFSVITRMIKSNSKRKLLWIFSFITFFMSALLGNLATVIVMIERHIDICLYDNRFGKRWRLVVSDRRCDHPAPLDRWKFECSASNYTYYNSGTCNDDCPIGHQHLYVQKRGEHQ